MLFIVLAIGPTTLGLARLHESYRIPILRTAGTEYGRANITPCTTVTIQKEYRSNHAFIWIIEVIIHILQKTRIFNSVRHFTQIMLLEKHILRHSIKDCFLNLLTVTFKLVAISIDFFTYIGRKQNVYVG